MTQIAPRILTPLLLTALSIGLLAAPKKASKEGSGPAILWEDPVDISTRNMTYGPGGPDHQPKGPFKFDKEDLNGTNPKYVVTGADGVKWKLKLGEEAQPETAASRIVWAAGYFTDEEYFLPDVKLDNVPAVLKRGENKVEPDGLTHNARLKRYIKGEEKNGTWEWKDNPFSGTRELNGLRVMMALINNWDLKDVNNTIYENDGKQIYVVSDLGASFGTASRKLTRAESKGNLAGYTESKFIKSVMPPFVNFGTPARPALIHAFEVQDFKSRINMEWIGKEVPIADARWIGSILAKLSMQQIQDAFAAAGYSPAQIVGFSAVVEQRIADLNNLPAN